jgi:hypothetical protein
VAAHALDSLDDSVGITRDDLAYAHAVGRELYGTQKEERTLSLADLVADLEE